MRHLFIINPMSGKSDSTRLIEAKLRAISFPYEVVYTTAVGDALRITEQAALLNVPTRIYACGGDGTLNEVVNGAAGHPHIAVTNVPKGTGNDFIKIFGNTARDAFFDLEALSGGTQTAFDLIDCNGRLSLASVCMGIDARVGADVHRYKRLPFISGKWAYNLSLLVNLVFKGLSRHMHVVINGVEWDGEAVLLCICNTCYYGGGYMPMPEAMPDDGILDILIVSKVKLFTFVRLIGTYARGEYKKAPHIMRDFHTTAVTISSTKPLTVGVDGEIMHALHIEISLSTKKVNFFYPIGLHYGATTAETQATATLATR